MRGLDVSHHQGVIDWYAVRQSGIEFAFMKATEGAGFRDSRFSWNRQQARRAGLLLGCYHFARPSRNKAIVEADHFLATVGDVQGDQLILDFEDENVSSGSKADWALAWLERVQARTGVVPILYTYKPYWLAHGSPDPQFARFPLWLAAYRSSPPAPPKPWPRIDIWQFTSSGSCAGIAGRVDLNDAFHYPEVDDMYSDADRARDEQMAKNVQEIHDAIYKGYPNYAQPGIEGMVAEIRKAVVK